MKRITTRGLSTLLSAMLICSSATQAQTITTVAGDGTGAYGGDGAAATAAQINDPRGVAFDAAGNMYITDPGNHRIRKVDLSGNISTFAGTGVAGGMGDGGAATSAELNSPYSLAFDHAGNLYFSDIVVNRVRRISPAGIITNFAGSGGVGYTGDGGQAILATFSSPSGVDIDNNDNVYITDAGTNTVRKVNAAGVITTVAGTGTNGFSGDGGAATAAELQAPHGVAFDGVGNMYIADQYNYRVRKVDLSGNISTVAGTGNAGYSGDGGAATAADIMSPTNIIFDNDGNMYMTNYNSFVIRKVDAAGIISTFAGMAYSAGYNGDNIAATSAKINHPYGITYGPDGNVYIADQLNNRIRKVELAACSTVDAGTILSSHGPIFCGNDSTLLTLNGANAGSGITYQWQASGDNITWHNIGGNVPFYATGMLDTQTYFRVIVTCVPAGISDTASYGITPQPIITPTINVSANPGTTVLAGVSVTFSATISGGGSNPTYQWQKNGVDIPGATNSTYTTTGLVDNDSITCILKSNAMCVTIDSVNSDTLVMHILSGVYSIEDASNFMVYPNPNNGVLHIAGQARGAQRAELQVLNVLGQVMYSKEIRVQNDMVDALIAMPTQMSNGLYLLHISAGSKNYVQHFSLYR